MNLYSTTNNIYAGLVSSVWEVLEGLMPVWNNNGLKL